ncbi:MAG: hypothetical protein NTV01_02185 [Bacteroidia bacterium]|nr:hypothetical protein [Bacteroidia bacterium]
MSLTKLTSSFCLLLIFPCANLKAQWSNDPKTNLTISGNSIISNVPAISSTSSGGCYITWVAWYKGDVGHSIKMCYLDSNGNFEWLPQSITLSPPENQPQEYPYSLITDHQDNAIIAFMDNRFENPDITVSKVNTSGQFMWGNNGHTFIMPNSREVIPVIALSEDNSVIVAFQSTRSNPIGTQVYSIFLQKLDSQGHEVWNPGGIEISDPTKSLEDPKVVAYPDGSCALIYFSLVRLTHEYVLRELLINRFDRVGQSMWPHPTSIRDTTFGFNVSWTQVNSFKSRDNLIYITWEDFRDNNLPNIYIQAINPDGRITLENMGLKLSSNNFSSQHSPQIGGEDSKGNVYVFWAEEELSTRNTILKGQLISNVGELLWDPTGNSFSEISYSGIINPKVFNDTIYIQYGQGSNSSDYKSKLLIEQLNLEGIQLFPPTLINDVFNDKTFVLQSAFSRNQCIFVWRETELAEVSVIKAQNYLTCGAIGPSGIENDGPLFTSDAISFHFDRFNQTLDFKGLSGNNQLILYNTNAQNVFFSNFSQSCRIPPLVAGLYYFVVSDEYKKYLLNGKILLTPNY